MSFQIGQSAGQIQSDPLDYCAVLRRVRPNRAIAPGDDEIGLESHAAFDWSTRQQAFNLLLCVLPLAAMHCFAYS